MEGPIATEGIRDNDGTLVTVPKVIVEDAFSPGKTSESYLCSSVDQRRYLPEEYNALLQSAKTNVSDNATVITSYPKDAITAYEEACYAIPRAFVITLPAYTLSCVDAASGISSQQVTGSMPACVLGTDNCEGIEKEQLVEAAKAARIVPGCNAVVHKRTPGCGPNAGVIDVVLAQGEISLNDLDDLECNETSADDLVDNKTSSDGLEDNKTSVDDLEDNKTSVYDLEDNKTSADGLEDNKTSADATSNATAVPSGPAPTPSSESS